MSETKLQSAAFFQEFEEHLAATSEAGEPTSHAAASTIRLERIALWISRGAAGAVAICVTILAVSFIAGIQLPKAISPMDWWLRFGGAKPDQSFQKFINDAVSKNQVDFAESYRKSPMYQLEQSQNFQLNPQMINGQFQHSPRGK